MLQPGTLIHHRYAIIGLVGQGAMGAVYEALDQHIGQTIALKQTLSPDPVSMGALEREAVILASLRHPALPAVSDTFSDPLGQFLAMEFVPGPTLADRLMQRNAGFSSRQVLAWADQILDALGYLHRQVPPVLHRDIKPQNLKLNAAGAVMLLDFGLARGAVLHTRLAGQRSVVGYTLPYAPIEQVRGHDTDPRSDLFALAGTLYHLLIGTPPPDALERAAARIAGQADPLVLLRSGLRPSLPRPAADAIDRCLSLDPAERIGSAEEFRRQLQMGVSPPTPLVPAAKRPAPPTSASAASVIIGVLVMLCMAFMIYVQIKAYNQGGQRIGRMATAAPMLNTPTPAPGPLSIGRSQDNVWLISCPHELWQRGLAFTPDGAQIAAACGKELKIFSTADGTIQHFLNYTVRQISLSPSGKLLAATAETQQIVLWRLSDGVVLRTILLEQDEAPLDIAIAPDDATLVLASSKRVVRYRIADGSAIDTLIHELGLDRASPLRVAYSPDGRYLAVGYPTSNLRIWSLDGGKPALILEQGDTPNSNNGVQQIIFSPDSSSVIIGTDSGPARRIRISDGAVIATYGERLHKTLQVAISPDGLIVAVGDFSGTVRLYASTSGTLLRSMNKDTLLGGLPPEIAFSPDGRSLAILTTRWLYLWKLDYTTLFANELDRPGRK